MSVKENVNIDLGVHHCVLVYFKNQIIFWKKVSSYFHCCMISLIVTMYLSAPWETICLPFLFRWPRTWHFMSHLKGFMLQFFTPSWNFLLFLCTCYFCFFMLFVVFVCFLCLVVILRLNYFDFRLNPDPLITLALFHSFL